MYDDYLRKVAERFANRFADIAAEFSFELGVEFEITLCRVLRQVLPQRYGICRGFVVTRDGDAHGDDIIIYDRDNFPTLRMVEQEGFERRESIPLEAVYAYIEAKHTLYLEGTEGQSLAKACQQVAAVKSLPRAAVPWTYQDPYFARPKETIEIPQSWPPTRNQMHGTIVARYVRQRRGGDVLAPDQVIGLLASIACPLGAPPYPDLIIAGTGVVCVPIINHGFHSPFLIEGKSHLSFRQVDGLAFGIGFCCLLFALDMMRLGGMPWAEMIADAAGVRWVAKANRGTIEVPFELPCYVLGKGLDQDQAIMVVYSGSKSYLALFTKPEIAQSWGADAQATDFSLRRIEFRQELRLLLGAAARDAVDEVALDPQPGQSDFKSVHIAFFLEDLDQAS
jgi:hypothetical protein